MVPGASWVSLEVAAISLRLAGQLVSARLSQLLWFQRGCGSSSSACGGDCVAPNNCTRFLVVFSFCF